MLGMNQKKMATIIIDRIKPKDEGMEKPDFVQKIGEMSEDPEIEMPEVEPSDVGLEVAAEELLSAIEAKDVKSIVEAFKSMMMIYETTPHKEIEEEE